MYRDMRVAWVNGGDDGLPVGTVPQAPSFQAPDSHKQITALPTSTVGQDEISARASLSWARRSSTYLANTSTIQNV